MALICQAEERQTDLAELLAVAVEAPDHDAGYALTLGLERDEIANACFVKAPDAHIGVPRATRLLPRTPRSDGVGSQSRQASLIVGCYRSAVIGPI